MTTDLTQGTAEHTRQQQVRASIWDRVRDTKDVADRPQARFGSVPRRRRWLFLGILAAVAVLAAVVGLNSLRGSSPRDIGDYGLIEALPPAYFAAIAVMTVGFVVYVARCSQVRWLGALYITAFVALLDGAPVMVEGTPRFPTTYVHEGFVEAIMRTGHTFPLLDARFSWPGFFSMFAYLQSAAGLRDTRPSAVAFPFVIKLLWLAATWVVLRRLVRDVPTCWLALWVFQLVEWSGQSYFSPQGLGVLIYLVCVAVLVVALDPADQDGSGARAAVAVALVAYAALVVTHQLTPFMVIAVAAMLALFGMTRARSLWLLFGVIFAVWFSFGATDFWAGHLADVFKDAGQVSSTLNNNIAGRLSGNAAHERVVYARMGISLTIWGFAALGILVAWKRRTLDGRLVVLGAAPLVVVALQSYGGEGLIRIFLFALPASAAAVAMLFMSARSPRARPTAYVLLTVFLLALIPVSFLTKYGGESYESVSPGELRAALWVHHHTRPGDLVASIAPAGLLHSQGIGQIDYGPTPDEYQIGNLESVRSFMENHNGGRRYLVVGPSQYAYGYLVSGLPKDWQHGFLRELRASSAFRLVHRDGPALVYRLKGSSR